MIVVGDILYQEQCNVPCTVRSQVIGGMFKNFHIINMAVFYLVNQMWPFLVLHLELYYFLILPLYLCDLFAPSIHMLLVQYR